jgi:universal stress protein E
MAVKRPESILVVVERTGDVPGLTGKSLALARRLGARVELYLCDSEQAFVLGHSYDRQGIGAAREASVATARRYLSDLRESMRAADVEIALDAECESPLYESVVRKALRSAPDLVIKAVARADATRPAMPDANDWQLMRTCPVMLMLSRDRAWRDPPRFAVALDVSEEESAEVSSRVLEAAVMLAKVFGAQLHVLYGETAAGGPQSAARLEKLRRLCDEAGVGPERTHVLHGQPERTLPEFARERSYDTLVMGALAHRSAGTTPVGTLTSTLLDALDCDFVLVKPRSYRSPIDTPGG